MIDRNDDFDVRNWDGTVEHGETTLVGACVTRFAFATNGMQGGDWGHGSRLMLEIEDEGSTALFTREGNRKISILVGGDAELLVVAEGLEYLARAVRASLVLK